MSAVLSPSAAREAGKGPTLGQQGVGIQPQSWGRGGGRDRVTKQVKQLLKGPQKVCLQIEPEFLYAG